jgi:hypothetical protein
MKIEYELREDSDHKANRNQPMGPDASWIEVGPKELNLLWSSIPN